MNKVAIVGYSTAKFRRSTDKSVYELACEPSMDILRSSNLAANRIEGLLFSSCSHDLYGGAILSEMLGVSPKLTCRIDNLCNSGTIAISTAYSYISSGLCDSVLVVGAELYNSPGSKLIWDVSRGHFTAPIYWASVFARMHMREYGTTEEDLANIAVKNRSSSVNNPNAMFNKPITLEDVLGSRKLVDPIKLLDCGALCSGSSSVLLVSEDLARKLGSQPVWIEGIGHQTNCASMAHAIPEIFNIGSCKLAASHAYEMAKMKPSDIQVAEIHDAFTIMEIMACEDLGFAKRGNGAAFALDGNIAVNPRGGIIGSGHPIGATGIAQVCEIVCQLRHESGERQAGSCNVGLVHNLAAAGTSATVMILRSEV
jgi:acetyl-CoA C-acetyltransferase